MQGVIEIYEDLGILAWKDFIETLKASSNLVVGILLWLPTMWYHAHYIKFDLKLALHA